jgi:hypothetical protein
MGATVAGEVLRTEQDVTQAWPRWFVRLARRIGKFEQGHAYTLTVVMSGSEPVWTVQSLGKVENDPNAQ